MDGSTDTTPVPWSFQGNRDMNIAYLRHGRINYKAHLLDIQKQVQQGRDAALVEQTTVSRMTG